MKVVFNGKPVTKNTLVELLESLKKNNLDSKDDKALLRGLERSYNAYLSREHEIDVWEKLQYQVINPSRKEGYEHPDQEKIKQSVELEKERAVDDFKLVCKEDIDTFLYDSLLNESMYGLDWEYTNIYRPNKGEAIFNFCAGGSFGLLQLKQFGIVSLASDGELELSYHGPEYKSPYDGAYTSPWGGYSTDDDSDSEDWSRSPWDNEFTEKNRLDSHNDSLRYNFASRVMSEWSGKVVDSGESKSNPEGYNVSHQFKKSLFSELEQYIIDRDKVRQQSGSEYFRFRFFGVPASVKIGAAEKLKQLCSNYGSLKLTGTLYLTGIEAKALINSSLGRTCYRHLYTRPEIRIALKKVAELNSEKESSIDLENGNFAFAHKKNVDTIPVASVAIPLPQTPSVPGLSQ